MGAERNSRQRGGARSVSDRKCMGQAQSTRRNRRGCDAGGPGSSAPVRQDGRTAQSDDLSDVGWMQLYHRRHDQHRWRPSSGGAEHVRGPFQAFAGRLAAGAGGHSSFHAQGKRRPVGLKRPRPGVGKPIGSSLNVVPTRPNSLGEAQWVWQSLQRASTDRKSTRLNSSHTVISYAVFCLKKKKKTKYCYSTYLFTHMQDSESLAFGLV